MDTFGLAVKELILLHLEEHFEEQFNFLAKKIAEPPIAVSQEGIKEGTGLTQPQISRGIKSLEKEELIERKKIFVKATGRFRDFYFLQRAGIHKATKLKEELDQKSVKVKDIAGKTKEIKISEIVNVGIPCIEIRPSNSYLVKEKMPEKVYDIFKYSTKKRAGICLTSAYPENIKRKHEIDTPIFWISDTTGENVLYPTRLDFEITNTISNFIKESKEGVVLIDSFEYLILKNGFEKALDFIKTTSDLISKYSAVLITQVNPEALGKRELTSLEGILETLPERLEAPLSLTHLEIIRYTVGGLLDVEKAIKREAIEKTIDFSKEELRPKHFFGRKDELKTLSKWVNERKKVLAISGELGIGKTALILKMLDDYEGRKHIFWYKCREWDTAKTIVSSLAAFLSKMNKKTLQQYVQSKESIELGEVSTILDTALQDVNALLIFDNSDRAKSDVVNLFSLIKELVTTKENTALVVIGRYIPKFYTASDINKKIVMELTVGGLDMESSRKILGPKIDNSDFKIIYKFTEGNPSLLEQISTEIEHQKDIKKYLREKIFSKMLMKGG